MKTTGIVFGVPFLIFPFWIVVKLFEIAEIAENAKTYTHEEVKKMFEDDE